MSITVRAPAKINLHLGVGAPRPDGFHPLVTVYQAVSLYDDLTASDSGTWSSSTIGSDYVQADGVPQGEDNIAVRAGRLLAQRHGLSRRAELATYKSIPVAGGMAGGSADAAAALVALDRLWDVRTPDDQLLALASRLGSDVPFALVGGTALGTGRGEIVEPWEDNGSWWWVVVPSQEGLSTPEVYRHWDTLFPDAAPEPAPAHRLIGALKTRRARSSCGDHAQRSAGGGRGSAPGSRGAAGARRGRGRVARDGVRLGSDVRVLVRRARRGERGRRCIGGYRIRGAGGSWPGRWGARAPHRRLSAVSTERIGSPWRT